jgi:hypothetical protein
MGWVRSGESRSILIGLRVPPKHAHTRTQKGAFETTMQTLYFFTPEVCVQGEGPSNLDTEQREPIYKPTIRVIP